jgi:hypothetical protein
VAGLRNGEASQKACALRGFYHFFLIPKDSLFMAEQLFQSFDLAQDMKLSQAAAEGSLLKGFALRMLLFSAAGAAITLGVAGDEAIQNWESGRSLYPYLQETLRDAGARVLEMGANFPLFAAGVATALVSAKSLLDAFRDFTWAVKGKFRSKVMGEGLKEVQAFYEKFATVLEKTGPRAAFDLADLKKPGVYKIDDLEADVRKATALRRSEEEIAVYDEDAEAGKLNIMHMKGGRVARDFGPAIEVYERDEDGTYKMVREGLFFVGGERVEEDAYREEVQHRADKEALWKQPGLH